jgi:hypothetical protein
MTWKFNAEQETEFQDVIKRIAIQNSTQMRANVWKV